MMKQVFRENEIRANRLIARIMLLAAGLMLVCWLLNIVGVLAVSSEYVLPVFLVSTAALVVPALVSEACRGEKRWNRLLLLLSVTTVLSYLDVILTFNVPLLIVLPVVLSCRYYSRWVTIRTAILSSVLFAFSAFFGAVINYQTPDMNFANPDLHEYVRDVMQLSFLPRWLIFVVISVFCCEIAHIGRKMVLEQSEISKKAARIDTELDMAYRIQTFALPSAEKLPENELRKFDLAAEMNPAKEVGGDFYDFFYPDPGHLALIIADVADKGIAASLYMMMSKVMLDTTIGSTLSPGQVLERVNRQLFEHSPRGMFVTAWVGILDLATGELVSASAGHEYPALCRKDGEFELIHDPHGAVLGARKSLQFSEYTVKLEAGDILFVYTDGLPEANNAKEEMFGTERMLCSLNRCRDGSMQDLLRNVKEDILQFSNTAPQFDDLTIMALKLLD